MADMSGWGSLGQALAGGGNTEAAYQRGQVNAARVAQLLSEAQIKRDQQLARQNLESSLTAAGNAPEQAGLLATALRGGFNPKEISGYTGDVQEQGFRGDSVARALAGDYNGANANLMGVANGPVALASVEGQNLINNRLMEGGGGISTTEQGRAGIGADAARAAASYASANSSNASAKAALGRLAIAQGQFGLERAGNWAPGRNFASAGGGGAGGGPGKLSEGQSKDVLYYTRGNEANKLLQTLGGNLTTGGQQGGLRSAADAFLRGLPGVGDSSTVNALVSPERQTAEQAGKEFLTSILRKDTGAAVTPAEFEIYGDMYLPRVGDSPAQLQQKARARDIALQSIRASMGNAASAIPIIAPAGGGSAAQALGGGPQPGAVQDGYRFRGGNPADPNAWERL
jgi:hypothetical protein